MGGFYIPTTLGNTWDWNYFWGVGSNFLSSMSPFALIIIAAIVAGYILTLLLKAVRRHKDVP